MNVFHLTVDFVLVANNSVAPVDVMKIRLQQQWKTQSHRKRLGSKVNNTRRWWCPTSFSKTVYAYPTYYCLKTAGMLLAGTASVDTLG